MLPVVLWLFLLIVLPHIDLLIMSFRFETEARRKGVEAVRSIWY